MGTVRLRWLLLFRFILVNALLACLAMALTASGYVAPVFETDSSRITYGIAGLFVIAWAGSAFHAWRISGWLNEQQTEILPAGEADRDKAFAKMAWLDYVAEILVSLGLIGTVVGFSMALAGVAQDTLGQASGAQSAVVFLMQGMQVALNTTLLGAALALWQGCNVLMLRTAATTYWCNRLAERDRQQWVSR